MSTMFRNIKIRAIVYDNLKKCAGHSFSEKIDRLLIRQNDIETITNKVIERITTAPKTTKEIIPQKIATGVLSECIPYSYDGLEDAEKDFVTKYSDQNVPSAVLNQMSMMAFKQFGKEKALILIKMANRQ